jgi:thioredoxin-like negative regulator of GroEL
MLFKGGQVVESVVGLAQKDDLKKVIDKHIDAQPDKAVEKPVDARA